MSEMKFVRNEQKAYICFVICPHSVRFKLFGCGEMLKQWVERVSYGRMIETVLLGL